MTLATGTRLGSYEITGALGAGGMGEVYRARDSKLGRDVALKVLPQAFARDADRMARFQREAKVLASLNHPNIASIYGLEDSGSTHALVMELVEGPTLADRIRQGPIPVEEALKIAKQICEALEYAHERGIVHRDLKPANVKVTADDAVKVLDFGLAKALEGDAASFDISTSPTISRLATMQGVLLGTAAYMSPEQAKGKTVDRRADIWAFGCVLYEMLTGKMAFHGESVTETLAAVITKEPEWSRLPTNTPAAVRILLQRCLQKEQKQRLQAIGDARISIEEVFSGAADDLPPSAPAPAKRWQLWVAGLASLFALGMVLFTFLYVRQKPVARQVIRFEIPLPENVTSRGGFALSPDGGKLAFIAKGADGHNGLWVRSLDTLLARPIDGTEGASDFPFWSPDGRFIAFFAGGKLKKIDASSGPPITLCDTPALSGGAWSRDGKIIFGSSAGTQQVSADGGPASLITARGNSNSPSLLPDGRHFVYLDDMGLGQSGTAIYVGSVDTKSQDQRFKKLLPDYSFVFYAPSPEPSVGYLLFVRGASGSGSVGTLMVQPFDTRRLELSGDAVEIAEHVSNVNFSVSKDVLAYVAGADSGRAVESRLTWFDRQGKPLGNVGDPHIYSNVAISPDGKRVAFDRADPRNPRNVNIWLYDFERGASTRFTFEDSVGTDPVWSPDGTQIAFASLREGQFDLYEKSSNLAGEAELLFKSAGENKVPSSWSPDGRFLLYFTLIPSGKLWVLPTGTGMDRKPTSVERTDFNETNARFSPDGRWIAYSSDESGNSEIYVRSFDDSSAEGKPATIAPGAGKWIVSKNGGTSPRWRRDGRELFYLTSEGGTAMAVEVNTTGTFRSGIPKALFRVPPGVIFWDVSSDGKRFLMAVPSGTSASSQPPFTVVLNWQAALKK